MKPSWCFVYFCIIKSSSWLFHSVVYRLLVCFYSHCLVPCFSPIVSHLPPVAQIHSFAFQRPGPLCPLITQGSSHIMADLWPLVRPWPLVSVCSCGESGHSSSSRSDSISLHCRECWKMFDRSTDNKTLRVKLVTMLTLLFSLKARQWVWTRCVNSKSPPSALLPQGPIESVLLPWINKPINCWANR